MHKPPFVSSREGNILSSSVMFLDFFFFCNIQEYSQVLRTKTCLSFGVHCSIHYDASELEGKDNTDTGGRWRLRSGVVGKAGEVRPRAEHFPSCFIFKYSSIFLSFEKNIHDLLPTPT
jgi:hypothetical protein